MTVAQIHRGFRSRRTDPVQLTHEFLERSVRSVHNAFITLDQDGAMERAHWAMARLQEDPEATRRFPLLGIPLGIKDNLTTRGLKTTCASRMLRQYVPPSSATAVTRLVSAGAVILGKTNLDEFAMGGSNENSAWGPVLHPTHPGRVPGGSSGGSATAVKADLCHASLGSDTGGSVRLPASYCGLVGLKPSYGRVSRAGLIAFGSSFDQVGPMTHQVEDSALLLDLMSGEDPLDCTTHARAPTHTHAQLNALSLQGLRIGLPREYFAQGLTPAVEKAVQTALRWYEKRGAQLIECALPHLPYSVAVYYVLAISEASSNLARYDGIRFGEVPPNASNTRGLAEYYATVRDQFGPEVKRRILMGTYALSSGVAGVLLRRAAQVRALIARDFAQVFTQVDILAGAVAPTTAFAIGHCAQDPLQMYLNDLFTVGANLAGIPALSVPCGSDEQGLPVGLHLQGSILEEWKILSAAHQYQQAHDAAA